MSTRRQPRKTVRMIEGYDGSSTEGWAPGDLAELTTDFENQRAQLRVGWVGTVEIVDERALWVRFQHTNALHRLYSSDVLRATVAADASPLAYEDAVQVVETGLFGTVIRYRETHATVQIWGSSDEGRSRFIDVAMSDVRKIAKAP